MSLIKQREVSEKNGKGRVFPAIDDGPSVATNGNTGTNGAASVSTGTCDRALDTHDLETMMQRFSIGMRKHAHSIVGSAELAEDVMQEVFARTISEVERGRKISASKIGSWLHTCVRNTALSVVREQKRHPQVYLDEGEDVVNHQSTHDAAHLAERSRSVMRTLSIMTERQSTAFLLSDVHGLSYSQTADEMGTSADSVRQLLFRARREIRRQLGPETAGLAVPILRARSGLSLHDPGLIERIRERLDYVVGKYLNIIGGVEDRVGAFATPAIAAVVLGGVVAVGIFSNDAAFSGGDGQANGIFSKSMALNTNAGGDRKPSVAGVTLRSNGTAVGYGQADRVGAGNSNNGNQSEGSGSDTDLSSSAKTAFKDLSSGGSSFSSVYFTDSCLVCNFGFSDDGDRRDDLNNWYNERKQLWQERHEDRVARRAERRERLQAGRESDSGRLSVDRLASTTVTRSNKSTSRSKSRGSRSGDSSSSRSRDRGGSRGSQGSGDNDSADTSPDSGAGTSAPDSGSTSSPVTSPVSPVSPSPGDSTGDSGGDGGSIGDRIDDRIDEPILDGDRDRRR